MPEPNGRNLVVCCDGTSNEIGSLLSNVLKLYRIAEKSDPHLGDRSQDQIVDLPTGQSASEVAARNVVWATIAGEA